MPAANAGAAGFPLRPGARHESNSTAAHPHRLHEPAAPVKVSVTGPAVVATTTLQPLNVQVTSADGPVRSRPVTFTFSDSTTVDVDVQGRRKALRLNMDAVTITATAELRRTGSIMTRYGPEIATGPDRRPDGACTDDLDDRVRAWRPGHGPVKLTVITFTRKFDGTEAASKMAPPAGPSRRMPSGNTCDGLSGRRTHGRTWLSHSRVQGSACRGD